MPAPNAGLPRCVPGDGAVVIQSDPPENFGRIVRVWWLDDGTSGVPFTWSGPTCWVTVATREPMVFPYADRARWFHLGALPDAWLQPIRGAAGELSGVDRRTT